MTSTTRPQFAEEEFRKASASNPTQECVRVARRSGWVELRDDKTQFGSPDDRRIVLTSAEFDRFQTGIRSGKSNGLPTRLDLQRDGTYLLRAAAVTLTFTEPEVRAFIAGIRNHEFDLAVYEPTSAA